MAGGGILGIGTPRERGHQYICAELELWGHQLHLGLCCVVAFSNVAYNHCDDGVPIRSRGSPGAGWR